MSHYDKGETIQVGLRLPASLVTWLRERAEQNARPLSSEVEYLLMPMWVTDLEGVLLAPGERDPLGRTLEDHNSDEELRRKAARYIARRRSEQG